MAGDRAGAARRIVDESCAAQGIEAKISDPVVLSKIATLFGLLGPPRGSVAATTYPLPTVDPRG
jgi:hypothetical protein